MARIACVVAGILLFSAGTGAAAPLKFSVVPGIETPRVKTVNGLDFGLLATSTSKINGCQIGLVYGRITARSIGAQIAPLAVSGDLDGAKWGIVSVASDLRGYNAAFVALCGSIIGVQQGVVCRSRGLLGLQVGIANFSVNASGLQLGLFNYTEKMDGVQVGLLNIITTSSHPAVPFFNFHFR
ncbi:MAG: LA_2272 family surface repeat-containing protein [Endomicrobiales bacterium]